MTMQRMELLAPAGGMEQLKAALRFGADAVYGGLSRHSLRAFAGNFDAAALREAVRLCHAQGARFYAAINALATDGELSDFVDTAREALEAGVDAAIVADVGVAAELRRQVPGLALHLSTQLSVCNASAAEALGAVTGAARVVLAREMRLEDVAALRRALSPDMALEAFVHGAMCVAYSGRCLLSAALAGRSANRGACAQPCRYQYALMEEKRPGEYFPVYEDEKGTYILNSRDMCMIDHIPDLLAAGVDSLKIEGRAKSAYYAAIVTGAYRHGIDAALAGVPLDPVWRDEVEKVSHRHYSTGFFYSQPGQFTQDARYIRDWQVLAVVQSCTPQGLATASLRNKFAQGDPIELVGPGLRPVAFQAPLMADAEGEALPEPRHPQMTFQIQLPCYAPPLSFLRACRENS